MAGAGVVAGDPFLFDRPLQRPDRFHRTIEECPRPGWAVAVQELRRAELESGQDKPAVPRAGARAQRPLLEQGHVAPGAGQRPCRRYAGVSAANDNHIGTVRQVGRRRYESLGGFSPEAPFEHVVTAKAGKEDRGTRVGPDGSYPSAGGGTKPEGRVNH